LNTTRVATPNDPKLSDRRSRRGPCGNAAGAKAVGAWAVTAQPVRCSAWLGVAVELKERSLMEKKKVLPLPCNSSHMLDRWMPMQE